MSKDKSPLKIYFSVDPEVRGGESRRNLKTLMQFLQDQGHTVYRAPYVLSENPDAFLRRELRLKKTPSFTQQREVHMRWIDDVDLLLADISVKSEGRSMIIQRALDKPAMGLPYTLIILIKGKRFERKFGKIVRGVIESDSVVYYEYTTIDEVIHNWPMLLKKAKRNS